MLCEPACSPVVECEEVPWADEECVEVVEYEEPLPLACAGGARNARTVSTAITGIRTSNVLANANFSGVGLSLH